MAGALANGTSVGGTWHRWDGGWYLHVARHGYADRPGSPAFYPLYPALVRGVGEVLGGQWAVAAVVVSLTASLFAFAALRAFVIGRLGADTARWSVALVAVFPYALFLQFAYSEALFLLLAVSAALALDRGRLVTAGFLAGLALLTRPLGVALIVAIAVAAIAERRLRAGALGVLASCAVAAAYPLLLVQQGRSALAFLHAESEWHRAVSSLGPLGGIERGVRAAWAGVLQLTWGPDKPYWTPGQPDLVAVLNITNLLATAFALGALPFVRRVLGWPWVAYCVCAILLPLVVPSTVETPLLSTGRFVLVLFPLTVVLAHSPRLRRFRPLLVAVSAAGLLAVVGWWTTGEFVA